MEVMVRFYILVTLVTLASSYMNVFCEASFDDHFDITFGDNHITKLDNGNAVELLIDPSSGAGFKSKLDFLSGSFEMKIKLPANLGDSGVVTTFYLIGQKSGSEHDELDFEFLGDKILQTNVFVDGVGGREQRFNFWFNPAEDFHTYKIVWNPFVILFFVDNTPIRVFKNKVDQGIPYIKRQMHIEASLWNASWAGGPVNWNNGPVKATYQGFEIHGCSSSHSPEECSSNGLEWNNVQGLTPEQTEALNQIRKQSLSYDYCDDPNRKPSNPEECVIS